VGKDRGRRGPHEEEKEEDPVPGDDDPVNAGPHPPPLGSGVRPEDDPEEDIQDEGHALIQRPDPEIVARIIEAQPPGPNDNREAYYEYLRRAVEVARTINNGWNVINTLLNTALLTFHLWLESRITTTPPPPPPPPPTTGDHPVITDPDAEFKKKISNPVPKHCFRHIYRDEKGAMRTLVVCTTHGH
jgi:hypothetical protein